MKCEGATNPESNKASDTLIYAGNNIDSLVAPGAYQTKMADGMVLPSDMHVRQYNSLQYSWPQHNSMHANELPPKITLNFAQDPPSVFHPEFHPECCNNATRSPPAPSRDESRLQGPTRDVMSSSLVGPWSLDSSRNSGSNPPHHPG